MTVESADCARRFREARKADATVKMTQIVREYVEETGKSFESIYRTLNDNPDQWKPTGDG